MNLARRIMFRTIGTGGGFVSNVPISQATLTASSQHSSSYTAPNAFNGDYGFSVGWISASSNPPNEDGSCWIQWEFTIPTTIQAFRFFPRGSGHGNFDDFRVKFSNTGVFNGEELLQVDFSAFPHDPAKEDFSEWGVIETPVPAYYMRFEMISGGEDYGNRVSICEAELYAL